MFLLKKILATLILPPAGPVRLALFGVWLTRSKTKFQCRLTPASSALSEAAVAKSRRWQHGDLRLATLIGNPLPGGMNRSGEALHEYLGRLYNRFKE